MKDFVDGRYAWVPEDHLRILPIVGDSRRLAVEYRTQLQRRPYVIRVQGVDRDGSVRDLELVIPLTVGFFEETEESWVPLGDGSAIADSTRLIVTIRTGTHLLPEHDVHLHASGTSLSLLDALTLTEEDQPFRHTLSLIYELTRSARRVRLRIFTTSGRCILTDKALPGHKGIHTFVWDGRDEDDHPVANGLYFAELCLWGAGDRKADSVLDKVVRAR
ncbi:MAG: hypothetical protein KAY24_12550, partial [Candidatus Eisenbacteria sp.]|nr:hypothetical protein [Candidatus Eisenbacteria bacterium]